MTDETAPGVDAIEENLSRVPLFSRLDRKNLRKLARLCVPRSFAAGDPVLEEGAMGLGLFLVTSGRIDIFRSSADREVQLGTAVGGDILGEIALVDDQPRTASAVAREDTECLLLTRDSFDTLVKKEPEIAWCIVPGLTERIRQLHERLSDDDRLAAELPDAVTEVDPEATESDVTEDEDDETADWSATVTRLLRIQYGLMAGAAKGLTGGAKAMESFLDGLADETDLKDNDSWSEVVDKVPDGVVEATREALKELEELPQAMTDAFRRYSREE